MSRLPKNILYNFLGQSLIIVLSFVAVKFIFKQLGADILGIIYFINSVSLLLSASLNLGINSTIIREFSIHYDSNRDYISSLLRTSTLFFWGIYLLVATSFYFLAPLLASNWLNFESLDARTAILILRLLGITAILALPASLYRSLFSGLQRMGFNNLIDVAALGLQQIGIIVILTANGRLLHVAYWIALSYTLRVLFYIGLSLKFFSLKSLLPGFSLAVIKHNLRYSLHMMTISLTSIVHTQVDKMIISKLLPLGAMGYYGLAYSSLAKGGLIPNAIGQAAFPHFSSLHKRGKRSELINQYWILQDIVCFVILPLFALVPFATIPLFSYIFNEQIAHIMLVPVALLSLGFYMNATIAVPYIFSISVGRPEITVRQNLYALVIVVPATALFIYYYGLVGAGLSWIFYHLFAYAYGMPRICRYCLKMPTQKWLFHFLKYLLLAGSVYGFLWGIIKSQYLFSIKMLGASYLFATFLFVAFSMLLLSRETKKVMVDYLKKFIEPIKRLCFRKFQ